MSGTRVPRPLVVALCAGYFLVLLDVTIVNVALPSIGARLHASSAGLAWVVDAYAVPLAALLLVAGAVGDRVGHRRLVVLGLSGIAIASAVCATAPGIGVLVAGRAAQGAAAALALPGTLALLTESAPDGATRARLVGLWAAIGGAALPAGPVLGGLLVTAVGWRAVFWVAVPVAALALVPVVRWDGAAPAARAPDGDATRSGVDWAGALLMATALGCVVTAIIEAGAVGTDSSHAVWRTAVLLIAAAAAGTALWLLERRTARPLLRIPRAAARPLLTASAVAGLMNLCSLGALFVTTQLLQDVLRLTPLLAGAVLLPTMLPLPLLGGPGGRLASRFGAWRMSAIGLTIAAVGFAGIAAVLLGNGHRMPPGGPLCVLVAALLLWGCGLGLLTPAVVSSALDAVPGAPGVAAGTSNTARQVGGAIGVAAFGALAGAPDAAGFVPRCGGLAAVTAVLFVTASVWCATMQRGARRTARRDTASTEDAGGAER